MTVNRVRGSCKIKYYEAALAGVAQWIEHGPANQRVAGSIPSPGHMPGLQARSPVGAGGERQPHIDVSPHLFLLPFPSV